MLASKSDNEAGAFDYGDPTDESFTLHDFPFPPFKLHTEIGRIEQKVEQFPVVFGHDLAHIGIVELKHPTRDRSSGRKLFRHGKVFVLEQKPILQRVSGGLHSLELVAGKAVCGVQEIGDAICPLERIHLVPDDIADEADSGD